MTSGNFTSVFIEDITVPVERQRKEFRDIEELAASLAEIGQINPITITRENILVAGERRLRAAKQLGWSHIHAQYVDADDQFTLHLIELQENTRRSDLTWQERNDAVADYHRLRAMQDPSWSQENTAKELGITSSAVSKHVSVKVAREADPELNNITRFSSAANAVARKKQRALNSAISEVVGETPPSPQTEPDSPAPPIHIFNTDAIDFMQSYSGAPFNFIHCDFPYGVQAGTSRGLIANAAYGKYPDMPEDYFEILSNFCEASRNLADTQSAHLLFWFSMKYYTPTVEALTAAGWKIQPFPLVWGKSDNAGIVSDARRQPRRIYETALIGSMGDRFIVKPVANHYYGPTTQQFQTSEKPRAMLEHFLPMFVDESTLMLDPTCGSGNALSIAHKLGAKYLVGVERDPEFYANACRNTGAPIE